MARARRIIRDGSLVLGGPPAQAEPHPKAVRQSIPAGTRLRRIYWPDRHGVTTTAMSFRRNGPRARFDHHRRPGPYPAAADDPDRGIFYAASTLECCVVECFGDDFVVDLTGARLAVLELQQPLRVLDLRGQAAIQAGTLAAINQDGGRQASQDWARYWYEHRDLGDVEGLIFAGAHNGEVAWAVSERAHRKFAIVVDCDAADDDVRAEILVIANDLGMHVS